MRPLFVGMARLTYVSRPVTTAMRSRKIAIMASQIARCVTTHVRRLLARCHCVATASLNPVLRPVMTVIPRPRNVPTAKRAVRFAHPSVKLRRARPTFAATGCWMPGSRRVTTEMRLTMIAVAMSVVRRVVAMVLFSPPTLKPVMTAIRQIPMVASIRALPRLVVTGWFSKG